jgi:(1->4)-alpha-D-glucan 1-alpha-D-glucosylmutase
MSARAVRPVRATYRLQFCRDFGFADARALVPYLAALGVSHVYASPLLLARIGSAHGYDIVDHARLNPEFGDAAEFDALVDTLHDHGMGLLLDCVPNHMGVGPDNPWWVDVLEWGRYSPFAEYFDIDWEPLEPTLAGKVLLPVLGDHYGAVLERGELRLVLDPDSGAFGVGYFDQRFPIAPRDYPQLLQAAAGLSPDAARQLEPLIADFRAGLKNTRSRRARREQVVALKRRLAVLLAQGSGPRPAVEAALDGVKGTPGDRRSFDALHELLDRQAYRLAFWRVAAHEINYRRFFDINDLAGLRMERPEVFEASHGLVRRLLRDGRIDGLRLDHVDGLRDPARYFERLQRLARSAVDPGMREGAPPLYLLVEKILAPHESLRDDWAVSGTTGYEFMAAVNGLFVDSAGERPLTRFYETLVGRHVDFAEIVVEAKHQIMQETLMGELNVLANTFSRVAKQDRGTRDYARTALRQALANVVAHFPVYRSYVTEKGASGEDRRYIDWAIGKARRAARSPDASIYDFIRSVLTLELPHDGYGYRRRDVQTAAFRFQQYTGTVMAKGVEDTAFYRFLRLVALNEVGGDPGRFGTRPAAFHEANQRRRLDHPESLLATATHDHKRGEDVRARLAVLSELPLEWTRRVRRWRQMNRRKRGELNGRPAPSHNDEYLFYQTVLGAWPPELIAPGFDGIKEFRKRIDAYLRKSAREASVHTSWVAPQEDYEHALSDFVGRVLDPALSQPFLEDLYGFAEQVAVTGAVNGLAQVLLKLVSPGVPDIYQGTEFWDLSLVDPDNRLPVDYAVRRAAMDAAPQASCDELLGYWRDGRIKQRVIQRALELRRRNPALFAEGDYQPLSAHGPHSQRVLALLRKHAGQSLLAVVPRLAWPLLEGSAQPLPAGWGETRLELPQECAPGTVLADLMSGAELVVSPDGQLEVQRVLARFPVALLLSC